MRQRTTSFNEESFSVHFGADGSSRQQNTAPFAFSNKPSIMVLLKRFWSSISTYASWSTCAITDRNGTTDF